MTLGPFLFMAPLALVALVALPVIWWVLRASPPAPRTQELPSLRLLDDVDPREETPDRTPWWVLLLRFAAAALAIIGLSQPVHAPVTVPGEAPEGALLVVIDDGWRAAHRWNDLIAAAEAAIEQSGRDTPVHLLRTAPRERAGDPAKRLSRQEALARLGSLSPVAWGVDRPAALARLDASGLAPGQVFWASDGLSDGTDTEFAAALASKAALSVYAAPPRTATALQSVMTDETGARVSLTRATPGEPLTVDVSARTRDGASLATARARFEAELTTATARFDLPGAALSRVASFRLAGSQSAGAVWLWDSASRRRRVGLVSTGTAAQPLLSDVHYVRKALEPFANLVEGDLETVLTARPDAIILTDVGTIPAPLADKLAEWIESGGALVRFAGPRLAAQTDGLLPVPLRRTARALGGALAWDEPQALAEFSQSSPFAGLARPDNALVRKQVLAQPTPDLQARTWARLADGSPVVTSDRRGSGTVTLFHITAGPDWSDLAYSSTFAQMLRRAIAAGRGGQAVDEDGAYAPQLILDGFGRLGAPPSTARPLQADAFATVQPSQTHPPGLYRGPAGTRAINAGAGAKPHRIADWPAGTRLLGEAATRSLTLGGPLLAGAVGLLALDLLIALALSGRLAGPRRAGAGVALGLGLLFVTPIAADAQSAAGTEAQSKAEAAALSLRFGYIRTGDDALDARMRTGLVGLSHVLFLRTSVEPAPPHGLDPVSDALELYPLIYYGVPDNVEGPLLSEEAIAALNRYMRTGGALVIDTREGGSFEPGEGSGALGQLLDGLDVPPLMPVPEDHVLTKSFYLLDTFPGRFEGSRLWIEATAGDGGSGGDGVSRLFVGDADWAGAWAVNERSRRPLFAVDGGERQREMARRFGINLVMYVLTGNYKSDQVHLPALLERLGKDDADAPERARDLDDRSPSAPANPQRPR